MAIRVPFLGEESLVNSMPGLQLCHPLLCVRLLLFLAELPPVLGRCKRDLHIITTQSLVELTLLGQDAAERTLFLGVFDQDPPRTVLPASAITVTGLRCQRALKVQKTHAPYKPQTRSYTSLTDPTEPTNLFTPFKSYGPTKPQKGAKRKPENTGLGV